MTLRPSNLPKLAVCPCYEASLKVNEAAIRGSALDALFRARLAGQPYQSEIFYTITDEDISVVEWAVTLLRVLAGGSQILSKERECSVVIPGFEQPGTVDALIKDKLAFADLKTGRKRNYYEQMAAYALGLMEKYFAQEWTAYVLFCDQQELITSQFTYQEAKEIIDGVIGHYHSSEKTPQPCEYCIWCAKAETCPPRLRAAGAALMVSSTDFDFNAVLTNDQKLGGFLTACAILDDFRKKAEEVAEERIQSGREIPGWKLATRRGAEFINHDEVGRHIQALGFGAVLAAYGNLSAKKFRTIWEAKMSKERAFPEEVVRRGRGTFYLRAVTARPPINKESTNAHV